MEFPSEPHVSPSPLRVGITGAEGFLGRHCCAKLRETPTLFTLVPFVRSWFDEPDAMAEFLDRCDAVVHFAGLSRHADGDHLYRVNLSLAESLARGLRPRVLEHRSGPCVYFVSTTHMDRDLPYHASKRDGSRLLVATGARVVTLFLANVFGEGSRPYYNSVVSTFCHLAACGQTPERMEDVELHLIAVDEAVESMASLILRGGETRTETIPHRHTIRLPDLWRMLKKFESLSCEPADATAFERALYRTYRAACECAKHEKNVPFPSL